MDNTNSQNKFQDFLDDQLFITWVKNPTRESDKYWQEYIDQHPDEKLQFEQAKYIITKLSNEKFTTKEADVHDVWGRICERIHFVNDKSRHVNIWYAAASVLLVVGIGILFQIYGGRRKDVDYSVLANTDYNGKQVKLIFSDNSERQFAAEDPSVRYYQDGKVLVDSTAVSAISYDSDKSEKNELNQLVVPRGKRSSLTFSDGTKLYLNSGSKVIYPVVFDKKKREIYVQGEAYLKVAHNKEWPFVVKTDHLDVKVLGTEFNIKSYRDEVTSSVVLVEGSVQAVTKSQSIMMAKNELLTVDNSTKETSLTKANVMELISWKDGWMYCVDEKIESVAKKLSRYYDVTIEFQEEDVKDLTLSGKLDIKEDCRKVLDVISFISPVDYKMIDDKIILTFKK